MGTEKRKNLLRSKLFYTFLIMLIYLVGKSLPLYGIDVTAYMDRTVDAEALLVQTISGDINQCSIFALGISPYMISSIAVQILSAFQNPESKKKTSPRKRNRLTLTFALLISILMAVTKVQELQFTATGTLLLFTRALAALEMVTGAFLIMHLVSGNQKYGIGGQSALIFLNILDGIIVTLQGQDIRKLTVPLLVSLFVMFVMLIMENTEKRIPVQRISIHNIYADKNYLAIKLNPIGVMPAMFATAFFILPQLLVTLLLWIFPENSNLLWIQERLVMTDPIGIAVYTLILFGLTVGFSRVMINPGELTDQFLKSGDSLCDLHAGRDTKRYLSKVLNRLSFTSAIVMSVCLCGPLVLQTMGKLEGTFTTLPSSVMMLTGVWCSLSREISAVRDLEAYKPFI